MFADETMELDPHCRIAVDTIRPMPSAAVLISPWTDLRSRTTNKQLWKSHHVAITPAAALELASAVASRRSSKRASVTQCAQPATVSRGSGGQVADSPATREIKKRLRPHCLHTINDVEDDLADENDPQTTLWESELETPDQTRSRAAVSKDVLFRRASRLSMMANMAAGAYAVDKGALVLSASVSVERAELSPMQGCFDGLSGLCIVVGGCEAMLSDALSLVQEAEAVGVTVKLTVKPGMPHIYPIFGAFCAESREGADEVAAFIIEEFALCSAHPDRQHHPERRLPPGAVFEPVWPARSWQE